MLLVILMFGILGRFVSKSQQSGQNCNREKTLLENLILVIMFTQRYSIRRFHSFSRSLIIIQFIDPDDGGHHEEILNSWNITNKYNVRKNIFNLNILIKIQQKFLKKKKNPKKREERLFYYFTLIFIIGHSRNMSRDISADTCMITRQFKLQLLVVAADNR